MLASGAAAIGAALAGCLDGSATPDATAVFPAATVYLDPDCGCCGLHADYLADAGATVTVVELPAAELYEMKADLGITREYQSCHTTELEDGYVVEGHVPVSVINELVETAPPVAVVGLPGMPSGSPGMPGSKDEEWVFYSIDEQGEVGEFTRK